MVREARTEFFSKHSYDFTTNSTHDLSGTFRQLAVSTNLLGTSIHEIQASWTGPEELKQAKLCFMIFTHRSEVSLCGTSLRIS